jgi:hypothetical protein
LSLATSSSFTATSTGTSARGTPDTGRDVGHEVGRYISLEKLIDASKETYYGALGESPPRAGTTASTTLSRGRTTSWGILIAAYREFESRTGALGGRGSKKALITTFIDSLMVTKFTIADIRQAAPGVSDGYINKLLGELKKDGKIEPLGTGRGARWRRLANN